MSSQNLKTLYVSLLRGLMQVPGVGLAEIWTGLVSWKNSSLPRSFSCIVMDQQYLVEKNKGVDHRPPNFETFVVAVVFEGQRGVSQVYEWRARAEDGCRQRCSWLQELDLRKLHQDHRQALALLATPTWRLLHDVDRMFTAPHFLRTSRRARITRFWNRWGCIAVKHPPVWTRFFLWDCNSFCGICP